MNTRYLVGALSILALPVAGQAATVSTCGPAICYEYDDAQAGIAHYGNPTLIEDTLRFLPVDFSAATLTIDEGAVTSASFVIDRVYTVSGQGISELSVDENGSYRTRGEGGVSADLFLQASSNAAIENAITSESFEALSPSEGLELWSLSASLSPDSVFDGASNDIALVIQNTLSAFGGGPSFINKAAVFGVNVVETPIPASGLLLLPAVAYLGRRSFRRVHKGGAAAA